MSASTANEESILCSSCGHERSKEAYSNSTLNKVTHKKIALSEVKCKLCSDLRTTLSELSMGLDSKSSKGSGSRTRDPSLQYIRVPLLAPIINEARAYFAAFPSISFQVHLGPTHGWRTSGEIIGIYTFWWRFYLQYVYVLSL